MRREHLLVCDIFNGTGGFCYVANELEFKMFPSDGETPRHGKQSLSWRGTHAP